VARRIVEIYCEQIFEHGLYHADPHPGNILVTPERDVVLLDFGAVAELGEAMRDGIVDLLQGMIASDTERILGSLRRMGIVRTGDSDELVERLVEVLHERLQSALRLETMHLRDIQIDPNLVFETLLDLRKLDIGIKELGQVFHVPSQWILLERTILMLTGLCTTLDDTLRPMEIIQPYLERMVLGREQDWSAFAVETAKKLGVQVITLPSELRKVLTRANRGRLEVRSPSVDEASRRLVGLGHQAIWALFCVASGVLAAIYDLHGRAGMAERLTYAAVAFGVLMLRSMVAHARR
jgi:predicted unusual protein kinase regulating ubiquinone biosynthesis (AarF/ABC1/UbiB family)